MNPRSQATTLLPFAALLALAGCATAHFSPGHTVYGTILLPPEVANIGLTVARPGPEFTLELPMTKARGARSAAAEGARAMLADPQAAVLFPVGYALGGIVGGVLGVGEAELKIATAAIQAVVPDLPLEDRIAHAIAGHFNAARPGFIRVIEANIPVEPLRAPGRLRREAGKRLTWIRPAPEPHPLAGSGIDTVIGIRVAFRGFQARPNPNVRSTGDLELYNPPLSLVLSVQVSAVRIRDWADLGGLTVHYESQPHQFTAWAAGDAAPLRRESEAALQEILREITRRLDCGRQPPPVYE